VVDKTGLTGSYRVSLKFQDERDAAATERASVRRLAVLFTRFDSSVSAAAAASCGHAGHRSHDGDAN
jgi:hypothetical protein